MAIVFSDMELIFHVFLPLTWHTDFKPNEHICSHIPSLYLPPIATNKNAIATYETSFARVVEPIYIDDFVLQHSDSLR